MIRVLTTECIEWNQYINRLPIKNRDIYYTREYYKLQEVNEDARGRLFIYEQDNDLAVYPFLLREIKGYNLEDLYYDIESAYGYGGPITSSDRDDFKERFEIEFIKYCKENNIIAEFVRFHPLMSNNDIFKKDIEVVHNRRTIYVDLNESLEEIWEKQIISKNRNMIRKAEKYGLKVEFKSDIKLFKEIYNSTMDKVNADRYYYFNELYYDSLKELDNVYISIKYEEECIASAIFMGYGEYFHYHLAGSKKEYLKYAPNNLLLWSAIQYAKEKGFKVMHLGGGLKNDVNDNLFKFKKSFSDHIGEFYIGKRVHNKQVYNDLIQRWEDENKRDSNIFLKYRL